MKLSQILTAGALTLSLVGVHGGAAIAEQPAKKAAAGAQAKPDMDAMMKAMAKYSDPNENHKKLHPMVGTWDVTVKMFMGPPGAKPMESKGTAERKLVLGDRFLQEEVKSTFDGKPFSGFGMTGYDNAKQKFFYTWFDTMATSVMLAEGTADATGKEITFTSAAFDPMTQKNKTMREVVRMEGDKRQVCEYYDKGEDGKERKTMEIVYVRRP